MTTRGFFGAYSLVAYKFRLKVYGSVREAGPALMKRLGRLSPEAGADLVGGIEALEASDAAGTLRVAKPIDASAGASR